MGFRLFSDEIEDGGKLPLTNVMNGYGHEGGNRSPQLAWEGAPEGTKSFVLTMRDPDLPTTAGLWHWVVIDIPADATRLEAGAGSGGVMPAGARQTRTDIAPSGYNGAAPPPGPPHRYIFTLYALSVDKLPVSDDPTPGMVELMATFNKVGVATLTVTYGA